MHENPFVESSIPIEILPLFHYHNIDPASSETSTYDCCEEREHQKENDNRGDNQFVNEEVLKDENVNIGSHASKENLDKIEDDDIKDNIHEYAVGGNSQDENGISLNFS